MRGTNFNLFLMNENGCIKCTNSNWVGTAYKIPRAEVNKLNNFKDLKQSGVYFLFGNSDSTGENVVYIGQSRVRKNGEGLLYRLQEHKRNPEKGYWEEAVVFTSSNNSLGPTEISYLENRFCNLALEAGRYIVKNGCDPSSGNVTPEKESDLEVFAEYAKMIITILGYKVFTPKQGQNVNQSKQNAKLFLTRIIKQLGKVIEAFGEQTEEGFVVMKGSTISPFEDDTIPTTIKEQRKNAKLNTDNVLQEDMLFSSPSYAAMFVIGKSANGLTSWKTTDGKTLKEIEN